MGNKICPKCSIFYCASVELDCCKFTEYLIVNKASINHLFDFISTYRGIVYEINFLFSERKILLFYVGYFNTTFIKKIYDILKNPPTSAFLVAKFVFHSM